jgi:hypothetical protein
MSNDELRTLLERNAQAVSLRPSIWQFTGRTKVRLKPGLACECDEWTLTAGSAPRMAATMPDRTGVLGRGALGSCPAISYAMWAARLGVELDSLEVEIEADYDTRGELGVSDDAARLLAGSLHRHGIEPGLRS